MVHVLEYYRYSIVRVLYSKLLTPTTQPCHKDVRGPRQDGIREWFLQADEFLTLRDSKAEFGKTTLFCSGNPGLGKTFLR